MVNKIIFFCSLLVVSFCPLANICAQITNACLLISGDHTSEGVNLTLRNVSPDTLYAFSTYFKEDISTSRYLHRYDAKDKVYKLSFLPLLPYLAPTLSDNVVFGERKVVTQGQLGFSFLVIPPGDSTEVQIAAESATSTEYMKDIYAERKTKFERIKWKKAKSRALSTPVQIEFAVYRNIDFSSPATFYLDEYNAARQALEYEIAKFELRGCTSLPKENK